MLIHVVFVPTGVGVSPAAIPTINARLITNTTKRKQSKEMIVTKQNTKRERGTERDRIVTTTTLTMIGTMDTS
jgi:hypothetical protein